jgi:hypothetical protein
MKVRGVKRKMFAKKNARHKWPGAYGVKFCYLETKRRRAGR